LDEPGKEDLGHGWVEDDESAGRRNRRDAGRLGELYEMGFFEVGSGGLVEERAARMGSVSSGRRVQPKWAKLQAPSFTCQEL
jgi:hypothetical protein